MPLGPFPAAYYDDRISVITPSPHEDARTRLASTMVALVTEHPRDATKLKAATLEALLRTPS